MSEYDKQAAAFLSKTGATIEAKFKTLGVHFAGDTLKRDIWSVRIVRGSRSYAFEFGGSIHDTMTRLERSVGVGNAHFFLVGRLDLLPTGATWKLKKATAALEAWATVGTDGRPTAYDVLAAMTKSEPADNVDDFADEFGYTKPSEALRVFKAVKKEYAALCQLFNEDEMAALAEIA